MSGADTVGRLVRLGLTNYEARAYVALVQRSGSTPPDVARTAGIPRPRVYDVLRSLVDKGLAHDRPGAGTGVTAVAPEDAARLLLDIHRARLENAAADADVLVSELQQTFEAGRSELDPLDYVELVRDPAVLATRFDELQQATQREMLVFNKPPVVVSQEENDAGRELARRATLRGVYQHDMVSDPVNVEGLRAFEAAGEQMRFVETLPTKMAIIDDRIVMVAMADPHAGQTTLTTMIVTNTELAACVRVAFEHYWDLGITLDEAITRHHG